VAEDLFDYVGLENLDQADDLHRTTKPGHSRERASDTCRTNQSDLARMPETSFWRRRSDTHGFRQPTWVDVTYASWRSGIAARPT
jgi:hypothetical protein